MFSFCHGSDKTTEEAKERAWDRSKSHSHRGPAKITQTTAQATPQLSPGVSWKQNIQTGKLEDKKFNKGDIYKDVKVKQTLKEHAL